MSTQPEPTGEWTARNIAKCYNIDSITATRIAFDVKAALDAEREKRTDDTKRLDWLEKASRNSPQDFADHRGRITRDGIDQWRFK